MREVTVIGYRCVMRGVLRRGIRRGRMRGGGDSAFARRLRLPGMRQRVPDEMVQDNPCAAARRRQVAVLRKMRLQKLVRKEKAPVTRRFSVMFAACGQMMLCHWHNDDAPAAQ